MSSALFLLAMSLMILPQEDHSAAAQPSETCAIEGLVLRAGTDEPLKKAWLTLNELGQGRRPYGTSTEASGRFVLKGIEPGRYTLHVQRNGYVNQQYGQRGPDQPGTPLSLAPGQTLRDIVFRLVPAAVITGRVYDEEGEPVGGAVVEVLSYRYIQGKRDLISAGGDLADDRGEYRIYGLAPGQYVVSAFLAPGWGRAAGTFSREAGKGDEESYPPTYFPSTADPTRATPLELHAGEEMAAIDIGLMPTRAVRVRGRVFNAVIGQPGQGVNLMLVPRDNSAASFVARKHTQVEDKKGIFEFAGVTRGAYFLEGHWWSDNQDYSGRVALDVSASDVEDVNLVISPGIPLSGHVRAEGDTKLKITDLTVDLNSREWSMSYGSEEARVKGDGSFVLPNVSGGEYEIGIGGMSDDCYLKSARLEGEDVLERGLTIAAGQVLGTLEVVIGSPAGRVDGVVLNQDQQPAPGSLVVLIPDSPRRGQSRLYGEAASDQYGRFTLSGITPGEYKIFAWE